MLTIELRINGQLVDAVNATNRGDVSVMVEDESLKGSCVYAVSRTGALITECEVYHDRKDGVVALAAKVLSRFDEIRKKR